MWGHGLLSRGDPGGSGPPTWASVLSAGSFDTASPSLLRATCCAQHTHSRHFRTLCTEPVVTYFRYITDKTRNDLPVVIFIEHWKTHAAFRGDSWLLSARKQMEVINQSNELQLESKVEVFLRQCKVYQSVFRLHTLHWLCAAPTYRVTFVSTYVLVQSLQCRR